jgi:DNA-binding IscR family transcriptional regulator
VCVATDDPSVKQTCMLGTAECSDSRACPCHKFWTQHRAKLHLFLASTNVADIAAFESRRRWRSEMEAAVGAQSRPRGTSA